jgi:hypothetical protein
MRKECDAVTSPGAKRQEDGALKRSLLRDIYDAE